MESSGERFHEVIPSSSDSVLNTQQTATVYARAKHAFKGRNNDEVFVLLFIFMLSFLNAVYLVVSIYNFDSNNLIFKK